MQKLTISKARKRREEGTALVEFALCFSLFWLPLFLGTYQIGFSLVREVEVTQMCRDAGHMFSEGKDFTLPVYKALLVSLAPTSFNMTSSGNTVLYLSTISYVDDLNCPGGLKPDSSSCPNYHKPVFTRQVPIGNAALRKSNFASTGAPAMDSAYNVLNKLDDPNAVATGFLNIIPLTSSSQTAYVSEMYVQSPEYTFWSFLGTAGQYARFVF